jgi:hypothetical protein
MTAATYSQPPAAVRGSLGRFHFSGAGLRSSGYKRWRDFQTAQAIATIGLKFRFIRGIPVKIAWFRKGRK